MGVLHHVVDDDAVLNALKMMREHCDFLILGVRNDMPESYKFKKRPLAFYSDAVGGRAIPTDFYLDVIVSE